MSSVAKGVIDKVRAEVGMEGSANLIKYMNSVTSMIELAEASHMNSLEVRSGLRKTNVSIAEVVCEAIDGVEHYIDTDVDKEFALAIKVDIKRAFANSAQRRVVAGMTLDISGDIEIDGKQHSIATFLASQESVPFRRAKLGEFSDMKSDDVLTNALINADCEQKVLIDSLKGRFINGDMKSTVGLMAAIDKLSGSVDMSIATIMTNTLVTCEAKETSDADAGLLLGNAFIIIKERINKATPALFADQTLNLIERTQFLVDRLKLSMSIAETMKEFRHRNLELIVEMGAVETRANTSEDAMAQAQEFAEIVSHKLRF